MKTKQQFFERLGIMSEFIEIRRTSGTIHFTDKAELFFIAVQYTIDLELSGRMFLSQWQQNIVTIEQATGKPWSEIRQIYEECVK